MRLFRKWWFWIIIAIFMMFGVPVIINELYKLNKGYITIWGASDVLSFYGAVLSFIGTVALGTLALWQNHLINKQNLDNMQPALSMRLTSVGSFLYLRVENTGMSVADNISISVLKLQNNGDVNDLRLDELFSSSFELHPKEIVQGRVAIDGSNICCEIFPILTIKVSYLRKDCGKRVAFERTVIYDSSNELTSDNQNRASLSAIQSDIDKIARANVRIANYLDGCKVAKFDELNIISRRSLKDDLSDAIKDSTLSKEEVISMIKEVITEKRSDSNENTPESEEDDNA